MGLRFTPFMPSRRFWSIGWARFAGRICGFSVAARKRALMVDWIRKGEH